MGNPCDLNLWLGNLFYNRLLVNSFFVVGSVVVAVLVPAYWRDRVGEVIAFIGPTSVAGAEQKLLSYTELFPRPKRGSVWLKSLLLTEVGPVKNILPRLPGLSNSFFLAVKSHL